MTRQETFIHQVKPHYPVVFLLTILLVCTVLGESATESLRFDRSAVLNGGIYRLFTAHLVHLSWSHMLMNGLAVIIGWLIFRQSMTNFQWLASIIGSGLLISGLLFLLGKTDWYVGFSGIIHGLMLQGIILDKKMGRIPKALIAAGLILKVAYEQWHGANDSIVKLIGGDVVLDAHLFGLIGGAVMIILLSLIKKHRGRYSGKNHAFIDS